MVKKVVGALWTGQNKGPNFICRWPFHLINKISLEHFSYEHGVVPLRETHDGSSGIFVDA